MINEIVMDEFVDDMSYTSQSHVVPHEPKNTLSSSTNRSRKRKNKERTIDHMCPKYWGLKLCQQWYLR